MKLVNLFGVPDKTFPTDVGDCNSPKLMAKFFQHITVDLLAHHVSNLIDSINFETTSLAQHKKQMHVPGYFFKVRERSGNCVPHQENSKFYLKVSEMSGNLIYFWIAITFGKERRN